MPLPLVNSVAAGVFTVVVSKAGYLLCVLQTTTFSTGEVVMGGVGLAVRVGCDHVIRPGRERGFSVHLSSPRSPAFCVLAGLVFVHFDPAWWPVVLQLLGWIDWC